MSKFKRRGHIGKSASIFFWARPKSRELHDRRIVQFYPLDVTSFNWLISKAVWQGQKNEVIHVFALVLQFVTLHVSHVHKDLKFFTDKAMHSRCATLVVST